MRDLRRHLGQLVMAGFDGPTIPVELRALAREFDLGGVILFGRNIEEPEQVAELAREARALARDVPLWVGIDQEGGRVARLREPFTVWPPMATLGRAGDEALVRKFAAALAAELAAVGVSLDFAPVLDVHTNPANPVIGDRAIGDRASDVGRLGRVIIETLQGTGIAACGKHFPGHGDTAVDSHHDLPVVEHGMDRLRAIELAPFAEAIAAKVASIMTAHVLVPALDERRPATLSPRLIGGVLRREMGFEGVIFTDDLEMKAVAGRYSIQDAAVGSLAAGCDGLLLCGADQQRQAEALEAIVRALEDERLTVADVERSLQRHVVMKERFLSRRRSGGPDWRQVVGCEEHRAVADRMAQYL